MRLPLSRAYPAAVGRDLVYGLRPEYIRLDSAGMQVPVVVIEPTGYETHIVVNFGGTENICIFRERVDVRPGEMISISIDPANVHLFDEQDGMRLSA